MKKSGDFYKAFIKGSDNKYYKIQADFDCHSDSVYSFLTDFKNFTKYYENIKSLKLISMNDSVCIHHTVIKTIWPFSDREMITKVETFRNGEKIIIKSSSFDDKSVKDNKETVRIDDFEEVLEIIKKGEKKCTLNIEGRIKIKECLPEWLQDRIILSGPVRTVELIHNKY